MNRLYTFEIDRDLTGTLKIRDELLNTEDRAKERAMSEMLNNSYIKKVISFKTYLTDISINDTINIKGQPFLVKSISASVDKSIELDIGAIRYD